MTASRCPSKKEIIRFFEEESADAVREREILEHVLACPECRLIFEAAMEIEARGREILHGLEGNDLGGADSRKRLRLRARTELRLLRRNRKPGKAAARRWIAVPAAGIALVALIVYLAAPGLFSGRSGERSGSLSEISLLKPRGTAAGTPLDFQWTSRHEVRSYRLEIYDQALEPVYRSAPLTQDRFVLPSSMESELKIGSIYFWKIVAAFTDDRTIESEFGRFIYKK
jgi:hypothetical protein